MLFGLAEKHMSILLLFLHLYHSVFDISSEKIVMERVLISIKYGKV